MSRVVFSAAASKDRQAITAYTVDHFGVQQARTLRDRFAKTIGILAESPGLGRLRPDLDPPGYTFRYFVMLRFIIVYEPIAETGIRVVRILHGMRQLTAALSRDPGTDT